MNKVFGIRLNSREAWAWQHMGNSEIRTLIAPEGICLRCRTSRAQRHTRNQWFCYPCQDELDQVNLLPELETLALQRLNHRLRNKILDLESQLVSQDSRDVPPDSQLDLFPSEC